MSRDRTEIDDLLVRRATEGLDADDARRLARLLAEDPDADAEWVDRLVGELDAATVADDEGALPADLRARLVAAVPTGADPGPAPTRKGRRRAPAERPERGGRAAPRWLAASGWAAAAAVAALWLIPGGAPDPGPLDFPAVAALSDAVVARWEPGGDPTGAEVSGEVVWSTVHQTGVMRLRGLAVNPPGEFQYQLWIFDRERDERYPVDGGVFDVAPGSTEAEVPITAKLHVDDPTLFAVTVEPPGGVVVSDRERIATLASVSD